MSAAHATVMYCFARNCRQQSVKFLPELVLRFSTVNVPADSVGLPLQS